MGEGEIRGRAGIVFERTGDGADQSLSLGAGKRLGNCLALWRLMLLGSASGLNTKFQLDALIIELVEESYRSKVP